jgi:hypothetical protein
MDLYMGEGHLLTVTACWLQESQIEAFLSSCSEAEAEGVTFRYMDGADALYAYLVKTELTRLPALPAVPAPSTAPVSIAIEVSNATTENTTEVAVDVGALSSLPS